jgi:ABC-type branched-subunit amino acid transport system substrate-binding protein
MLAVAEINTAGGILGRNVDLVLGDAGQTDAEAVAASRALVEIDGVDAVVGMHPSNVRAAIRRAISGRVPYIYTPQFEGGEEHSPYLVTTGGTDDEVLGPAIAWLAEERGARRFFLIGNDYVWPQRAHEIARNLVQTCGAQVVGQSIVPWATSDHTAVLDAIRAARPDVVVMALLGMEAVTFNRAFTEAGLASKMLRLGLAVDETVLHSTGSENTENLYVSLNYFAHMHSAANDRFLENYHDCFGELAPAVNLSCQSCYEGVYYLADLARSIGRGNGAALASGVRRPVGRSRARSTLLKTPMGPKLTVHLAAADGIEFRTVASC